MTHLFPLFRRVFFLLLCMSIHPLWAQLPTRLIGGDYADPTLLRDGDDFYMTHSSFHYAPGLLVWHSTNLIDWTPIAHAVGAEDYSIFAPELVKYKDTFYIYYPTSTGENYVVYADDPKGPWSEPVKLEIQGIDPGHVVGEDGKRYLFVNDGWVAPLSDDGLQIVGKARKVYEGWKFPENWETEGMWLESPKLCKRGDYFYLTSAEGGTAGPATSHMCVSARSKSIFGPWENSPYNPSVHTYSVTEPWWSKGHGTVMDDANGNWWIVYHAYAKGLHTLGRQTLIEPIEWTQDGWYVPSQRPQRMPGKPSTASASTDQTFDFTQLSSLPLTLSFWKECPYNDPNPTYWQKRSPKSGINLTREGLTVQGKGTTPADGRLMLMTAKDRCYAVETEVTVDRGGQGGLVLFYNEQAFVGVTSDGQRCTLYQPDGRSTTLPVSLGNSFKIRLENRSNQLTIRACGTGSSWNTLAEGLDVSKLNHNVHNGFFALRPALLTIGKGKATYRYWNYSNIIPQEQEMEAYLLVYHQDEDHSLHAALSRDGYTFTALNNGNPIIKGDTIADQKGIRDPHIYRGPDGAFYLAMTDLHIYAQREGFRDTEWERDGARYGWGNNRGLVLMKSFDLLHWTRANIRFDELSQEFAQIGCAWAPETIYDDQTGRMMVYFTMRFGTEPNRLYYVYVNDAFDRIESVPQILFQHPGDGISAIDGDITPLRNPETGKMEYHLFYVAHDGESGIKHAVSDRINGGYRFDPRWYDYEPAACEAPNVWKRIGEKKWVLMYDIFSIQPHNFGFVETSDFVHFNYLKLFNTGPMKTTNFQSPKHGAVITLTKEEADRLEAAYH